MPGIGLGGQRQRHGRAPGETQLRFAVQQFIEQHLAQVDLPMLSAQFGLSQNAAVPAVLP